MSENSRPRGESRTGTGSNGSRSQGSQGSKRGSRRRRRGGSKNKAAQGKSSGSASTSGAQAAPGKNTPADGSTSSAQKPSSAPKPGPSSGQRQQGGKGGQGGQGANDDKQSSRNRRSRRGRGRAATRNTQGRGRSNARRRPQRQRNNQYQGSKIETRDETSAGGLVVSGLAEAVREDGSVALDRIYVALIGRLDRRGRLLWSMPKGHVEPGEDIAATAAREVWEETGIHGEVFAELGVIDYWFVSEGVRIHKTVHHHLLRYVDGDLNDEDPEVTEVSWIPASALIEHFAYADERKLARIAHDLLPEVVCTEHAEGRTTPR